MKRVIIILVSLCLVAAALLYQQEIVNFAFKLFGKKQEAPIKPIAFLNEVNKNVTYKRAANTGWGIGENNLGLALFDSVSTGAYSTTLIKFNIGILFNLDENSLVVIEEPKQSIPNLTEINFHQGSFEAKNNAANDALLVVKSNKLTTEIKGKFDFGMAVDKNNKTAKVWVKIGQAKISDEMGHQVLVNENESKDFSTEEIQPPKPEVKPEPIAEPKPVTHTPRVKKIKLKRLTTNEIRRIISNQRQKIDTCYARRSRPGGGRVNVAISIRNTGQVISADVASSTFGDPILEKCVAFWMKAVKFPKFDGEPINDNANIVFR